MDLTDEQRAGLAKFLGVRSIEPEDSVISPHWVDDICVRPWSDADLTLALLERAAEQNYYVRIGPNHAPDYPGDFILRDWSASICELPFDPEREVTFYGATPLEAMVEGVLQLPEAQP